jgi:hypothetical protein
MRFSPKNYLKWMRRNECIMLADLSLTLQNVSEKELDNNF